MCILRKISTSLRRLSSLDRPLALIQDAILHVFCSALVSEQVLCWLRTVSENCLELRASAWSLRTFPFLLIDHSLYSQCDLFWYIDIDIYIIQCKIIQIFSPPLISWHVFYRLYHFRSNISILWQTWQVFLFPCSCEDLLTINKARVIFWLKSRLPIDTCTKKDIIIAYNRWSIYKGARDVSKTLWKYLDLTVKGYLLQVKPS